MKRIYLFFLAAFLVTACQPENESFVYENKYEKLTAEEYLKTYTTPMVLFQYLNVAEDGSIAEGIMIDNKGQIFQYNQESLNFSPDKLDAPINEIFRLLTVAEKSEIKVDLEDLVDFYKMTRKVDIDLLEAKESNQGGNFYFVGYDVTYDDLGYETCRAVGVSDNIYVQKLLKSSKSMNKSIYAQNIVKWMAELLDKSDS